MTLLDHVREARRSSRGREWLATYRSALGEAIDSGDLTTAAELTVMAAIALEADGRLEEALSQLQHGITVAGSSAPARAHLHSVRAAFLAVAGRLSEARVALSEARLALDSAPAPRSLLEWRAYDAVVRAIALDSELGPELRAVAADCDADGLGWLATGVRRWTVPYLVACGQADAVAPVIDTIGALAGRQASRWRLEDVESFETAVSARHVLPDVSALVARSDSAINRDARWTFLCLALWALSLSRQADIPLEQLLTRFRAACAHLQSDQRGAAGAIEALMGALSLDGMSLGLEPPDHVTLTSLPGVLAGSVAVALAGDRALVRLWTIWWDAEFPQHVRTSLEWPVAALRCRALLDLRLGEDVVARMRQTVTWSRSAGYEIEQATTELQLAEVLALGPKPVPERTWRELRSGAFGALRTSGADPVLTAGVANRVIALGAARSSDQPLTQREVEVLQLLAAGRSIRQTGAALGLSWRTVQTHSKNIYRKLGVHSRVEAARVAAELKLLAPSRRASELPQPVAPHSSASRPA